MCVIITARLVTFRLVVRVRVAVHKEKIKFRIAGEELDAHLPEIYTELNTDGPLDSLDPFQDLPCSDLRVIHFLGAFLASLNAIATAWEISVTGSPLEDLRVPALCSRITVLNFERWRGDSRRSAALTLAFLRGMYHLANWSRNTRARLAALDPSRILRVGPRTSSRVRVSFRIFGAAFFPTLPGFLILNVGGLVLPAFVGLVYLPPINGGLVLPACLVRANAPKGIALLPVLPN